MPTWHATSQNWTWYHTFQLAHLNQPTSPVACWYNLAITCLLIICFFFNFYNKYWISNFRLHNYCLKKNLNYKENTNFLKNFKKTYFLLLGYFDACSYVCLALDVLCSYTFDMDIWILVLFWNLSVLDHFYKPNL